MDVPESNSNWIMIKGIAVPTVLAYFATFNRGDFVATAALFAPQGTMHPPFESPIAGKEAIAAYLKAEAKGMNLAPQEGISEAEANNQTKVTVSGKVQTSVFGVNVAWHFLLNGQQEIEYLRIKLLASPQELLKLRR